jgi:sensor histidine kinase YesM
MFKIALNRFYKRLLFAVLLALAGGLLLEVVFRLQYRNYLLMQSWEWYIGAIVLTVMYVEIVSLFNKRFDSTLSWDKKPVYRLNMQILVHSLAALALFNGIRLLYVLLFSEQQFILLNDEITIAVFVLIVAIVLNIFDFALILLYQWRESLAEAEKYKKESAEFEFEMLQAQINPHFLFNSLNTLSSLVYEDADRSAEFIRKLSDVYRHVLESRHKDVISIEEEISFIRSYIFLLELRFGEKLTIDLNIEDEYLKRKILPLSLQLLIENAVKHNIVSQKRPLSISIYNDNRYIIVENPLQPKAVSKQGNRMGLKNISNRYRALSGEQIIVRIEDEQFSVKLPII